MIPILSVFVAFIVIVPCLSSPAYVEPFTGVNRIVNGHTSVLGQQPWQAQIRIRTSSGQALCGGSLLNNEWVVTAAHCADAALSFSIILGALNLNGPESGRLTLESSVKIVHENYIPQLLRNDIALIKLPTKVTFNEQIQPVSLPSVSRYKQQYVGASTISSGWGLMFTYGAPAQKLQWAQLEVISNAYCTQFYGPSIIQSTVICAIGAKKESVCNGDSGGPLVLKGTNTLLGITSFGSSSGCDLGYATGFTRVSMYLSWISKNTGITLKSLEE